MVFCRGCGNHRERPVAAGRRTSSALFRCIALGSKNTKSNNNKTTTSLRASRWARAALGPLAVLTGALIHFPKLATLQTPYLANAKIEKIEINKNKTVLTRIPVRNWLKSLIVQPRRARARSMGSEKQEWETTHSALSVKIQRKDPGVGPPMTRTSASLP